jgi:anti-sigma regulatory factor (Ser/Thr protein kinase)
VIAKILDPSHVGEARRVAREFGRRTGGNEGQLGRIAIVATEMATNIVKHTQGAGGMIVIDHFSDAQGSGVELMAIDKGPGMSDVDVSLADGHSTAGSPGTGLGAISRQADAFAIYSRGGLGAVISARFVLTPRVAASTRTDVGALRDAYPGESVCGDGWAFNIGARGPTLLVVDGSGHGPFAAQAAETAIRLFNDHAGRDCTDLVERIHRSLVPTRGAALAVARIDTREKVIRFVGVGNIAGSVLSGVEARQMVSHNGTAGHIAPRIREFTYPFTAAPCVILHSDGVSNRWRVADYPGLAACHPSVIAAVLFRDFRRGRDDATVAVMRSR